MPLSFLKIFIINNNDNKKITNVKFFDKNIEFVKKDKTLF